MKQTIAPTSSRQRKPAPVRASTNVPRPLSNIVPKSLNTTLTYYDFFVFSSGGAASHGIVSLRANSCRDPVVAAGGGSPSGFTQLSYLYHQIRVNKIDVHVWGNNTCAQPVILGLFFRSSRGSLFTTGVECQQMLMEMCPQNEVATMSIASATFGYPSFDLRTSRTVAAIEGHAVQDNDYASSFGVEPNTQCYLDVVMVAADGATVSITSNVHIRLVYHVTVSEPNQTYTD